MHPTPKLHRSKLLFLAALVVFAIPYLSSQSSTSPAKLPNYDIVSVKPNKSGSRSSRIYSHDGVYTATNISLKVLLLNAYDLKEAQLIGLPGWSDTAHFDIQAKVLDPNRTVLDNLSQEQRGSMLKAILVERFQFKSHNETTVLPVYELVVAKGGPKFKPSDAEKFNFTVNSGQLTVTGGLMSSLVFSLSDEMQRVVIDKTGLTGKYDVTLKWSADDAPVTDTSPPILLTALQEQLGLKLVPTKATIPTLVIDHVAMPTEN